MDTESECKECQQHRIYYTTIEQDSFCNNDTMQGLLRLRYLEEEGSVILKYGKTVGRSSSMLEHSISILTPTRCHDLLPSQLRFVVSTKACLSSEPASIAICIINVIYPKCQRKRIRLGRCGIPFYAKIGAFPGGFLGAALGHPLGPFQTYSKPVFNARRQIASSLTSPSHLRRDKPFPS